jgi:hypothetical protein
LLGNSAIPAIRDIPEALHVKSEKKVYHQMPAIQPDSGAKETLPDSQNRDLSQDCYTNPLHAKTQFEAG